MTLPRNRPNRAALPRRAALVVRVLVPSLLWVLSASVQAEPAEPDLERPAGGFEHPVLVIPEIGLWADGMAEVGFAKKTGLAIWWGLDPAAATAAGGERSLGKSAIDWRKVSFRVRAEITNEKGKRVARKEELVDPLHLDVFAEEGGFPAPIRAGLKPGRYRVRLEAYPLISAGAAGLERVPHGVVEVSASIPQITYASKGWRLGDVLFLSSVRRWAPGAPSERTWYEWVIEPSVARAFEPDSSAAYLAFEVLRSEEPVPRCVGNSCRIVITIADTTGAIRQQELRPVPAPASVAAYLIPFRPSDLASGSYRARIEVYEGQELEAAVSREFRIIPAID